MPFFRKYAISFLRILILCVIFFSCKKEEPQRVPVTNEVSHDLVNAWLSFNLNIVSSGTSTKVASDVSGGVNDGIDENVIKRLVIWLVPVDSGTEDWSKTIMVYVPDLSLTSGSVYKAAVKTKLNVPMNVYVGANLSTILAGDFLDGGPMAVYRSAAESYSDLVKEFASEEMGVAMFCSQAGTITFTEEHTEESTPAGLNVDLIRMLAKTHLLFQCYDSPNDGFVKITKPGSLDPAEFGEFGWSKLEDISYILNGVNRSSYIYRNGYPLSPYIDYKDVNHSMSDLLEKDIEWNYKTGKDEEFFFFAENHLLNHEEEWNAWSAIPEKFIESRAPFGSGEPYINGLYCLENTTDGDILSLMTDDEKKYVPFMVTTHLIVKARFVPRIIISGTDSYGTPVSTAFASDQYSDALGFLEERKSSLGHKDYLGNDIVDENGNVTDYPQGTFFTRDMKEFYSYDGMIAVIESKGYPRKSFASYPGGYGFYYSYILGDNDSSTGQVTFDCENSGVFRNHYHILKCSLMKVPATPGSFNQLMMVNSKVVDWNPKGSLNMIVKPNV